MLGRGGLLVHGELAGLDGAGLFGLCLGHLLLHLGRHEAVLALVFDLGLVIARAIDTRATVFAGAQEARLVRRRVTGARDGRAMVVGHAGRQRSGHRKEGGQGEGGADQGVAHSVGN